MSSIFLFTQNNYSSAIRHLEQAFSESLETKMDDDPNKIQSCDRYLHNWRVEYSKESPKNDDTEPYLVHDTVAILDSTLAHIDDAIVSDDLHSYVQVDDDILLHNRHNTKVIEMSFSVCFSHVWCVPVLYFRVHDLHGKIVSRASLLYFIKQECHMTTGDMSGDMEWDETFISEAEHPVTGVPCFFLHPCHTSARLHILSQSLQDESYHVTQLHSILILSWLSMVLPALRFCISPIRFSDLVKHIKSLPLPY